VVAVPIEILIVDDSEADVDLTQELLRDSKVINHINVCTDGVEALRFLKREAPYQDSPRPDLILLDLNMPRKDGRELLQDIKQDECLMRIPVVVLTTSQEDKDVLQSYNLHANCYVTKPFDLEQFMAVVSAISNFWLSVVKLPPA